MQTLRASRAVRPAARKAVKVQASAVQRVAQVRHLSAASLSPQRSNKS